MESGLRLIRYRCTLPTHQKGSNGKVADMLTVFEGDWAYCAFDAHAKEHRWEAVEAMPLDALMRLGAAIDPTAQPEPEPAAAVAAPPAKRAAPRPTKRRA